MAVTANNRLSNQHIITTEKDRVEVIASPGSGKTYTLLKRFQHLRNNGVPVRNILVLSFSTASVLEICRRLSVLEGVEVASPPLSTTPSKYKLKVSTNVSESIGVSQSIDVSQVTVQTAHSFAYELLRRHSEAHTLLEDQEVFLKNVILSMQRDVETGSLWDDKPESIRNSRTEQLKALSAPSLVRRVADLLNFARAEKTDLAKAIVQDRFMEIKPYWNVLLEIRRQFSKLKKANQVIDFADMLTQAIKIIDSHPESVPYTYILVDEYQDCSAAQVDLLVRLAKLAGRRLMVFGDPNQAIFGFSGASYRPLSSVLEGVQEYSLPVSRRLTAQTAALASLVAQHDESRAIQTTRQGSMPELITSESLAAQNQRIASDIRALIDSGVAHNQIVVLARTKALLAPVEQALLAQQVSTNQMGLIRDKNHAMNVLRLVRMLEMCETSGKKIDFETLRSVLPDLPISESTGKRHVQSLNKVLRVSSLEGRYRLCARVYLRCLGGVRANKDLRADVNRWELFCRDYSAAPLMGRAILKIDACAVVTGSIHAAKGGEWDHVFVVGVTQGLLPLYLTREKRMWAEERNLLFVAITRAKEAVRLYHAPTNHARSRQRFTSISEFLDESSECLTVTLNI